MTFSAADSVYSVLVTIDGVATGATEIVGNDKANKIMAGANSVPVRRIVCGV